MNGFRHRLSLRLLLAAVLLGTACASGPEICGDWKLENSPWLLESYRLVENDLSLHCDGTFSSRVRVLDPKQESQIVAYDGTYRVDEGQLVLHYRLNNAQQTDRYYLGESADDRLVLGFTVGEGQSVYVRASVSN